MSAPAPNTLREATRAYVLAAMEFVVARRGERQDDNDGLPEWVRASPEYFRLQPRVYHWWADCIHLHGDELHALPQYKTLMDLIEADAQLLPMLDAQVGMGTPARRVERHNIADHMLWEMASRFATGAFDNADFDAAYVEWDAELRATHVSQVWIVPLMGLSGLDSAISLSKDMAVCSLSDEDIALLLSAGLQLSLGESPFPSPLRHVSTVYGLRIVRHHRRILGKGDRTLQDAEAEWSTVNDLAEDALVALRIFKAEKVGTSGFAMYQASWPLRGSMQVGGLKDFPNLARQYGLAYGLEADDGPSLLAFFAACQKAKCYGPIGLAMRRFAYAADRSRAEDQILDLMIAAEALFLFGNSGELSYRCALHAAFFLSPELGSRAAVRQFFKTAYGVRSAIAHGSMQKTKELKNFDGTSCKDIGDFARQLENAMRVALRKAVVHTANAGQFLKDKDWDALIVNESN